MICPNCETKMRHSITPLSTRDNEPAIHSGLTCYNCGKWINDELEVVKPSIPLPEPSLARPMAGRPKTPPKPLSLHRVKASSTLRKAVIERMPIITEMRTDGKSYNDIALALKKNGFQISYTALRKHYQAILGG